MSGTERPDLPGMAPGAVDQLAEIQGLAPGDPSVLSAIRTAARLRALAREAAHGLRFGTEPTEFERLFGALAPMPEPDD